MILLLGCSSLNFACQNSELTERPYLRVSGAAWDETTLTERTQTGFLGGTITETVLERERDLIQIADGFSYRDTDGRKVSGYGASVEVMQIGHLDALDFGIGWQQYLPVVPVVPVVNPYLRGSANVGFFESGGGMQLGLRGAAGLEIPLGESLFLDAHYSSMFLIDSFDLKIIDLNDEPSDYDGNTLYVGVGWEL